MRFSKRLRIAMGVAFSLPAAHAQPTPDSLTDAVASGRFRTGAITAVALDATPAGSPSGITEYTSRSAFNIVAPGLPCQDFESAAISGILGFPAPLNRNTVNAVFAVGQVLPGLTFRDDPLNDSGPPDAPGSPNGLSSIPAGSLGSDSKVVVANSFTDAFEVVFDPPVNAAGMDLIHITSSGTTISIALFDANNDQIASSARSGSPSGIFWGFLSPSPVARMRLLSTAATGDGAEGVDDLCSGFIGDPPGLNDYDGRPAFNVTAPAQTCENFSLGTGIAITGFPAPLSAFTSNAVFVPGQIAAGIEFRDSPLNASGGGAANGLVLIPAGSLGSDSRVVGSNSFLDAYEMAFVPPVTAIGMDLVHFSSNDTPILLEWFGVGGARLGQTHRRGSNVGRFWGLTSANPIGRLRLLSVAGAGNGVEAADDICFANPRAVCRTPGLAIGDNATVSDVLTLPPGGTVQRLRLSLGISHTFVDDLTVRLRHVDSGTLITAVDSPTCNGNDIVLSLDDAARLSIQDDCRTGANPDQAFTAGAAYRPANPMAAFNGLPLGGQWQLEVSDGSFGDVGTLASWCLLAAPDDRIFRNGYQPLPAL